MRCNHLVFFISLFSVLAHAQELKTKNVILITLDGVRWQEIFEGADSAILFNPEYVKAKNKEILIDTFWSSNLHERRRKLFPFLWNTVASQGQLLGNRNYYNFVNCANPHWFSYPGYSEMLVGFVDRKVRSNDKVDNPNATVLEFIHNHKQYQGKVAVFSTWDTFPFIIREETSGIPVNAGFEPARGDLTDKEIMLNELQQLISNPFGSRYDAFTFYFALEYLNRERPRVLFISFDETDEHTHGGRYDEYLLSAHRADAMLATLWNWLQSQPDYKDQTTLLVTTDHGRGKGAKHAWRNHGRLAFGSGQIWIAAIGPDTPDLGELRFPNQLYQKQIAKTLAAFLGLEYENIMPVGDVIDVLFYTPQYRASVTAPGND
ncbi:MAG: alkaline phosphatase family protein [Cyclobacteriaceae bacterium]|nr:alkaline phosphatase family protein [Cyclobacteriaceae bacterium]